MIVKVYLLKAEVVSKEINSPEAFLYPKMAFM